MQDIIKVMQQVKSVLKQKGNIEAKNLHGMTGSKITNS